MKIHSKGILNAKWIKKQIFSEPQDRNSAQPLSGATHPGGHTSPHENAAASALVAGRVRVESKDANRVN